MKNMTIKNIAEACSGEIHGEYNEEAEATCVVIDSRLVEEGGVFIATKGERVDGHSWMISDMPNVQYKVYWIWRRGR